jgi:tRNA(His) 5'-end guanylyltransferase
MFSLLKKLFTVFCDFYIGKNDDDNCNRCDKYDNNKYENSLRTRMKHYLSRYNSYCHYYKPHIISLKSKKLLFFVNHLTSFDEKLEILKEHNQMLVGVCSKLYERFDPHMIYTFNNEIHLVFYYNDDGDVLYYGNINKLTTSIVSYASICMEKFLSQKGVNIDFLFEGEFVEFDKDYETLNYLIWRQLDCKRNNTVLLYRCLKQNEILDSKLNLDKIKIEEMQKEFKNYRSEQNKTELDINESIFTGNIIKRQLYYKEGVPKKEIEYNEKQQEAEPKLYSRKRLVVEHFDLVNNFKENARKYIYNKVM